MRVLGAIDFALGKSKEERIKNVSQMTFTDEDGNPRRFTWRTIQEWFYLYKNHGIEGIQYHIRKDKGKTRKTTPEEVAEAINQALPHFRKDKINKSSIYRFCIERGLIRREQIARTTFFRFIRNYGLLDNNTDPENKGRLAFSMEYANQLWQGDTMFGPNVQNGNNGYIQTKLVAFLDDASRACCHGEFFFSENIDALIKTMKAAFYKRGIPEQLYVDNGSIYTSQEITLICARLGCILRYAPLRDAASKGKIERFFRTVREQFLSRNLDLSSLEALNRQFISWVEDEYNSSVHSGIGMKPIDRFGLDLNRIRFLPPSPTNDELFFAETTRKVKKDNTLIGGLKVHHFWRDRVSQCWRFIVYQ
jgi:transposase InsO family protein